MTNNTFKYVSLFSGVGGFEQALNGLGGECVMSSEIDKFANQAYEVLYGHKTVGDVTKVAAGDVPDHDVLVGGFPCQAFSVAGKRLGFDDTRGTLFFEIERIAKEKKPKLLLLENVKGLVSHLSKLDFESALNQQINKGTIFWERNENLPTITSDTVKKNAESYLQRILLNELGLMKSKSSILSKSILDIPIEKVESYLGYGVMKKLLSLKTQISRITKKLKDCPNVQIQQLGCKGDDLVLNLSQLSLTENLKIRDISISEETVSMLNEAELLWKNILVESYLATKSSIISTEISPMIELRTCIYAMVEVNIIVSIIKHLGLSVNLLRKVSLILTKQVEPMFSFPTLDVIISSLNDIGYTVDFNVLNSKYFGVPQNRERIFIVGILNGEIEPWKIEGTNVVAKGKKRISAYEGVKTFNFDWPTQDTVTTRLRDILEDEVDERYYLSEDKTAKLIAQFEEQRPSITDEIKCYNPRDIDTVEQTRMQDRVYDIEGNTVALTSFCDRMNIAEPQMIGHVNIKGHDAIKRVYSVEGVSPTLTTMGGGHREPKILEDSRYIGTLADHERFKDVYGVLDVDGQCTTLTTMQGGGREPKIAVKSIGNVNPSGNGMNGQVYDSKGLSPTLTTNKGEGTKITVSEVRPVLSVAIREATKQGYIIAEVGDSINVQFPNSKTRRGRVGKGVAQTLETSCNQATLTPSYRIRKLTPKECFRLQGFADYEFDKLVGTSISNSQLYKMAGNAVTVNVIEAIGTRLLKYLSHNEIGSRYVTEKGA